MSNDEFISITANWLQKLKIVVSECENVINNNDMSGMERSGKKMVETCDDAKDAIEPVDVTIEVHNMKNLFIEILFDFRAAGMDCQNHNADSAMDHINSGKNNAVTLGRELEEFGQSQRARA